MMFADRIKTFLFADLFYLLVFFPYVQIIPTGTDTQPYALIFSVVIFMFALPNKLPKELVLLMIPFIMSIIMIFVDGIGITVIRSIANYASLFFISFATFYILKVQKGFNGLILKRTIYVWFIVGFIQRFINNEFLTFLAGRSIGSVGGRGVTGLTPEPTFYGIMCIFFLILTYLHFENKRNMILLLLIQIFIFAQSSMAIILLAVLGIFYLIVNMKSVKTLLFFIVAIITCIAGYQLIADSEIVTDTRIYKLLNLLLEDPTLIFLADASGNERFFHIYFSFLGFFQNYFLPHGFTAWATYLTNIIQDYKDYVWWINIGDRIMSSYGATLFELGFIGMLIPYSINLAIYKYYKKEIKKFITLSLFFNTMLMTAIPLALPLIGFFIGYFTYYSRIRE